MTEIGNITTKRHSYAHLLAAAVLELYPQAKLGMGPAIENGFYYDFDIDKSISIDDLPKIEAQMKKLISNNIDFEQENVSLSSARELFKDQLYKLEIIDDIEKDGKNEVSIYKSGEFTDLCNGPHISLTNELDIDAFKLERVAGVYWKNNESNKQLQRIYGVAFDSKMELDEYLKNLEEAKKRDHRKLGKELDLFVFSDLVGPGLPLFTPKGTLIKDLLQKKVEGICRKYGFEKVMTPHLAKIKLYETSGHASKFSDELFHVTSKRKQEYVIRPVLCPHQTQLYASNIRSYKELPIRYMESDKMYRAEKPGEIGGLTRVIAITVEDGHSFCRVDQVKQEIKNMVEIIRSFYGDLGMWGNHKVSLSVRDYERQEKYIGESGDWDECEKILQEVSDEMDLGAIRHEGEAALYGPKLDFMFKDATGREIQIPTVQLDFATPKRFKLSYINKEGKEEAPVMVHRAILGSYERFIALLLEHYAGAFPVWLAPVQARVISVSEKANGYADEVVLKLSNVGVRAEADKSNETLGKKIRTGQMQKIPYLLVVGDKEIEAKNVAVRSRDDGDMGSKSVDEFVGLLKSDK